jgi:hypothetical protein
MVLLVAPGVVLAVIVYSSVTEYGPAPVGQVVVTGGNTPIAVNVFDASVNPGGANTALFWLPNVVSVTVHPAGKAFEVKLLVQLTAPSGEVRPDNVTKTLMVPAVPEDTFACVLFRTPGAGGVRADTLFRVKVP